MIYLSSTTDVSLDTGHFGVMLSALKPIGGWRDSLDSGTPWMLDNGAFSNRWDATTWLKSLLKYQQWRETCIGAIAPDVVGDALETLRRFSQYYRIIGDVGYPVAFATQDGITPEIAPWAHFDVLFIGGSDDHKLGNETGAMIAEAKHREKWIHVGRVNSAQRIKQFWMCDSVDGTTLNIDAGQARREKEQRLAVAIEYCNNRNAGILGPNGQHIIELIT